MAAKNVYVCSNCGKKSTSPLAVCFACHAEDAYTLESSASNPQKKTANITTAKPLGITRSVVRHISQIESTATTRISTGISEFDRVLGGGIVSGSVILLGGEPGMGKCVKEDTFVATEFGFVTMKDLVPSETKESIFVPKEFLIQSINGSEQVSHIYNSGMQETIKVQTKVGYDLEGTKEHPVLVLNANGETIWKELQQLRLGDYIAIDRSHPLFGHNDTLPVTKFEQSINKFVVPICLDDTFAYITGALIGDGTLTRRNEIVITGIDTEVLDTFETWANTLSLRFAKKGKSPSYTITNVGLRNWLCSIGLTYVAANKKNIPDYILRSSRPYVKAALQGIFDTDGSALNNGEIEFCTVSEKLAKQVHLLLLQFGIVSTLKSRITSNQLAWIIDIRSTNAKLFYEQIGFRIKRKQMRSRLVSEISNPNLDVLPYLPQLDFTKLSGSRTNGGKRRNLKRYISGKRHMSYRVAKEYLSSYPELHELIDSNYYWDEITLLESGNARCVDLCVPTTHAFVANGVVSHNSTLCLQTAGNLSQQRTVLYVSAEESAEQIKMRADRIQLQAGDLQVVLESDLEVIMEEHIPNIKPDMLIIDSIHTIASSRIDGTPGSQRQLKHCEIYLRQLAKSTGLPILMIGQVTKSGDVAGSNSLQHDVDAVLYLEGDQNYLYRLLRGQKNRFGNVGEIGVFEMLGSGLIEVKNPSAAFLAERAIDKAGSAVVVTMEGDRPILAELQALTIHGSGGTPARRSNGVHKDRLHLLAAILEKHIPYISLWDEDIYMSAAGGMKIVEPAADLPIAIAITSSWHEVATPSDMIAIGEIGLTGEIRNIPHAEMRLREAKKLGFRRVIMPPQGKSISKPSGLEIIEVRTLDEALHATFGDKIDYEARERVGQKVDSNEEGE